MALNNGNGTDTTMLVSPYYGMPFGAVAETVFSEAEIAGSEYCFSSLSVTADSVLAVASAVAMAI